MCGPGVWPRFRKKPKRDVKGCVCRWLNETPEYVRNTYVTRAYYTRVTHVQYYVHTYYLEFVLILSVTQRSTYVIRTLYVRVTHVSLRMAKINTALYVKPM